MGLSGAKLSLDINWANPAMTLTRTYDNRGRVSGEFDQNSQGNNIYSYSLIGGYDGVGNVTGFNDSVMGKWGFVYDNLNRLKSASVINSNYAGGSLAGATMGWTYDAFGNRTSQTGTMGLPNAWATFDSLNRFTATNNAAAVTYDLAGNIYDDGINRYKYDAENRVCAVNYNHSPTSTQYIYDAMGNRIAKGQTTAFSCDVTSNGFVASSNYVIGSNGEQLDEYDGTGANPVHSNVFASGRLLATYKGSSWQYAFNDWLGTKRAQISADGNLGNLSTFGSLPFGDGLYKTGADATEQHFTGKERDTESGLDYFGARYYGPLMGRFLSPDWSAKPEDVPYADLEDPQSLNLYSYVKNNPLSHMDKDGHCLEDACVVEGAAAAFAIRATTTYLSSPAGQQALQAGAKLLQSGVQAISGLFHSTNQSPAASPSPAAAAQPGQKDADFVVTPSGTAVATDPGRVRDSLANAPGVTTTPVTGPSGETGTIQTGVKTPNGPVDVRTMDGSSSHGPRTVITHPGTNSPKTPDGKATNDKNDNHIPNDHKRPQ